MPDHEFCPGYHQEPFRTLCAQYPREEVYPNAHFRTEWGPIFHRGRLDGSARVLVIGQDPATHEMVVRRILIGVAGQRVQGFLRRLGITRRYVLINTFLYGVYGQHNADKHKNDAKIAAYRNRWIDAIMGPGHVQAVVTTGNLAHAAWKTWKKTPAGQASGVLEVKIMHPTAPESASGNSPAKLAEHTKALLKNWNGALKKLRPVVTDTDAAPLTSGYGDRFFPQDLINVPDFDLPAGTPDWMRLTDQWAFRDGTTAALKRQTLKVIWPGV